MERSNPGGIASSPSAPRHDRGCPLTLADLRDLTLQGALVVHGKATFLGEVDVQGTLSLSKQQGGFATVRQGARTVAVTFTRAFAEPPIVTATATSGFALHRIAEVSVTGFTLEVSERAAADVTFAWLALAVRSPGATVGEDGGGATPAAQEATPAPDEAPAPAESASDSAPGGASPDRPVEPSPPGVVAASSPEPERAVPSPVPTLEPSPEPAPT